MVAEFLEGDALDSAKVLPHQPHVHLDRNIFKRRWTLSHGLTGEEVELQEPYDENLDLIFDDDAFGCVVSDEHVTFVRDLFRAEAWQGQNGEYILQEPHIVDGEKEDHTVGALDALQSFGRSAPCTHAAGRIALRSHWTSFSSPAAKEGVQFWFSAANLFSKGLAGFEQVKFPSTWVHKALPAWQAALARLQADQHLLKSTP